MKRGLIAGMLALVVALAIVSPAAAQQRRVPPKTPPNPIAADAPATLRPFYNALHDLQTGRRQHVVILQIGDSHTASDHFSGRLRDLFQQRFGNGGRGMMPAGVPYAYYRPYQVSVSQSEGWTVWNSFRGDQGPFGVTGYTLHTTRAGEQMSLEAGADGPFDEVEIDYLRQPGGGSIDVIVDGRTVGTINTNGNQVQANGQRFNLGRLSQTMSLVVRGSGVVDLLGWNLLRQQRGVILSAQGFSGATVDILDRFDPQIAAWQIRRLDPALVILAFGTNEGFQTKLSVDEYADALAARISVLRSEAPNAAILLVGPPDAERLPSWCGAASAAQKERFRCAPLTRSEAINYTALINSQARSLCRWHTPANIQVVRDIMRRVAQQQGAYFWDWQKALPGPCGMDAWARAKTPLAHADRVHMREDGYARSADVLYNEIMRPYQAR